MNSENMARVLQNMIEEAEENLLYLEKVHEGREHLTSRFAELKEAMDLEAELGGPLLSEDKPSPEPAPAEQGEELHHIGPERAALRTLYGAIQNNGEWEDGCFYFHGHSASELQGPLDIAEKALAARPAPTDEKALREAAGAFLKDMEILVSSPELLREALRLAELGQPLTLTDQLSTRLRALLAHETPKDESAEEEPR